jgi:hypothetical protein
LEGSDSGLIKASQVLLRGTEENPKNLIPDKIGTEYLQNMSVKFYCIWTGFIWLRTETSGGHLCLLFIWRNLQRAGSRFLQYVGKFLSDYKASCPRRQYSSYILDVLSCSLGDR